MKRWRVRYSGVLILILLAALLTTACSTSSTTSSAPATTAQVTTTSSAPTSKPQATTVTTSAPAATTTATKPPVSTTPSAVPTSTTTKQYGGILRSLGVTGAAAPIGWPAEAVGASTPSVKPALETLIRQDNSGRITPWLAESWQIAADGKSITFKLVKGVKYHDGSDFNAQALKFNLDALKDAKKAVTSQWTAIEVVDDYTLKISLKGYQSSILTLMASGVQFISPTSYNKNGIEWARWNPVGTGPFKFVSFNRDVSSKYTKFDGYWKKGMPYLDGFEGYVIQDPLTRAAAFLSGFGQVISSADAKTAYDMSQKGYEVLNRVTGYSVLLPDSTHADSPLSNTKVRQAIEYAIDKASIAKTLGYGYMEAATQATVPGGMAYNPDIKGRVYDPAKSKQLLTEAGYPNGFTTTITPDPQTYDSNAVLAIQSYLSKVGINAKLNIVDAGKYTDLRQKGWTGIVSCAFSEYPDYGATMQTYISSDSTQFGTVKTPEGYQDTLNKALAATDYDTQKALDQKLVKIIFDDATIIPVCTGANRNVLQAGVHDTGYFTTGHFTCWTPEAAWLEQVK